MDNKFLTILTAPQNFFIGIEERPVSLGIPAVIVLLMGIVSAISAYIVTGVTMQVLPASSQQMIGIIQGIGAISAIIVVLVMWFIMAGIFYLISMAFNGTGDFKRVLEVTGYGYIPSLIGSIISLPLMFQYLSTIHLPSIADPTLMQSAMTGMMKTPSMAVISLIGIVFLLWSANIWIFGVREARHLTTRNAVITVGIPVLVSVLFSIYGLIA
ncbi:Yip1 family protein [Methanosphaerula palustris]|uniref:Yip1 domain-containing protein n=1 Tax=Methanosphaerula palustris (strain ATCC BAA-1556 / DSM 19958 / E1-9c) TaxID=521011 RepID=B8GHI5_METPE|nr:Yip1 family protein [Methanosphaerula palustris]ACL16590.1 conserved hypothetical protein [Methanosphaerula palustris E1-9c]